MFAIERSRYPLIPYPTLAKRAASFGIPDDLDARAEALRFWQRYFAQGKPVDEAIKSEFLHALFAGVLGYRSPFEPDERGWEMEFEPMPALGFFGDGFAHPVVEIVVGDAFAPPKATSETAEWVLVTDLREIRLYRVDALPLFHQSFLLADLAENPDILKQFYFLLCRRALLPATMHSREPSRISRLVESVRRTEMETTREFCDRLHAIRGQLIKDFRYRLQPLAADPTLALETESLDALAIAKAQQLIGRVLFVAFCESHHLLPPNLLADAYAFENPYIHQPAWENYKAVFRWIERGHPTHVPPIPAFGNAPFAPDRVLDELLFVGDELCRQLKELTRFDFREQLGLSAIAYAFDETLRELQALPPTKSRRRRVPPLHRFPSASAIVPACLREALERCLQHVPPPSGNPTEDLQYWQQRYQCLKELRVFDPECGTGLTLAIAGDYLVAEYDRVAAKIQLLSSLVGSELPALPPISAAMVLQHHLFGSDRTPERVELAKLLLWLWALQPEYPPVPLDANLCVRSDRGIPPALAATSSVLVTLPSG